MNAKQFTTPTEIYIDGGSRGNPGNAGGGIVIEYNSHTHEAAHWFGDNVTNNEAEYLALLTALETAVENDLTNIHINTDSKLLANQVRGDWDCNSTTLEPLLDRARELLDEFSVWEIEHIPRNENADADELANKAMDDRDTTQHVQ